MKRRINILIDEDVYEKIKYFAKEDDRPIVREINVLMRYITDMYKPGIPSSLRKED